MSQNDLRWLESAVIYQIYPRSFKDSNGDGVGDLAGITDCLKYLNDGTQKSLGVSAIWLSPIYRSPMADFGYDISDYCDVDPLFGSLGDFDRLVREAHQRGIKVIMDFVPNHTSSQHPWFLQSRSSRNNPRREWYIWKDGKEGSPPNNWLSHFGGSAWELDPSTNQYYLHSFLKQQPDLNWRNPEVQEAMLNVMQFWLKRGVDGFRTDAIDFLIKDEQLRDNPSNPNFVPGKDDPFNAFLHTHSRRQPETLEMIKLFCSVLKEFPGTFMISEIYAEIDELVQYYRACEEGLQIPFNFNLLALPWEAKSYCQFIESFEKSLRAQDLPNYVLGNHDRPRVASRLGQEGARLAAMLIFTLRGLPFIYYGEELGMENTEIPNASVQDPWEKNVPGFHLGRDPQRTPMQWDTSPNAGFTFAQPWLPVSGSFTHVNAATQAADTRSMLNLYKFLIHYRHQNPVLQKGKYETLPLENPEVYAYTRSLDGRSVAVCLNFSKAPQSVKLPVTAKRLICTTCLDKPSGEPLNTNQLELRPNEGVIVEV